jgi:hypothetical protein
MSLVTEINEYSDRNPNRQKPKKWKETKPQGYIQIFTQKMKICCYVYMESSKMDGFSYPWSLHLWYAFVFAPQSSRVLFSHVVQNSERVEEVERERQTEQRETGR